MKAEHPGKLLSRVSIGALCTLLSISALAADTATEDAAAKASQRAAATVSEASCALLDDPKKVGMMDGLLYYLARGCGREAEFLGRVESPEGVAGGTTREPNVDLNVSDPSGDTGGTRTQSETSIARSPVTGTLCAAWNDSFHGITGGQGFSGFARSTDGGDSWDDRGAVSGDDSGDPSLVWRKTDEKFYYAALRNGGLGLYRSDDDCQSFTFVSQIVSDNDDKEIMAIDNDESSPFYGRIYVVWTDFGSNDQIYSIHSSDAGATWSTQLAISPAGVDVQGAWPTIAPGGDIYVAWLSWLGAGFPNGDVEITVRVSTDGGVSYSAVEPPMTGRTNPRDQAAQAACSRPAIKGNIRMLPSPQIAVGNGYLHAIYSYDPDGFNVGDVIDVFYRRFNIDTSTWDAEVKINDDTTMTDQYQPTLGVGDAGQITVGYYSRENDPNNLLLDYYSRTSFDNGATWNQPSERLSDVSSSIVLDGQLANCYHGDYDQQLQDGEGKAHYLWSDDRDSTPDVFTDRTLVGVDFLLVPGNSNLSLCAPDDAIYDLTINQFQGFSEPVTLSASGNPAGSMVDFSDNPVTPPSTSTVTISTAGVDAGAYSVLVEGTSDPSSIVQSTTLGLNVFTMVPGVPLLTMPADMATVVPTQPEFTWDAADQGASYVLEVDDEPTFTDPLIYTATVSGTSHTPSVPLPSNSQLYWRVRSDNICGMGTEADAFTFTTVPLPGDCPMGSSQNALYFTDFEGSVSEWTLGAGSSGPSNWAISTARPFSGSNAFLATDVTTVSDQRLISPSVMLPTGQDPLSLIFYSDQTLEDRTGGCWDGGIVEISTDGGTTFTQLSGAALLTDPYDGPFSGANPLVPMDGWCGDPEAYLRSVVDLSAFAGQTVRFRFRLGTDGSVGRVPDGWYIDDVTVQSCTLGPPNNIFANSFE
ncbi:MAG: hypothetical protein KDI71_12625 [Xanthomonadales bacterium]|nr:hypothetical protein [Xanthomonadales bacterium]